MFFFLNNNNNKLCLNLFQATMLKKSKNKIKRRNTEPSIFFPDNEPLRLQSPSDETEPL